MSGVLPAAEVERLGVALAKLLAEWWQQSGATTGAAIDNNKTPRPEAPYPDGGLIVANVQAGQPTQSEAPYGT